MNLFPQGCRMTQKMGVRAEYYKKITQGRLAAHEGWDLVPLGDDKRVFSKWNGKVVEDVDDVNARGYGVRLRVWYPELNIIVIYAHLEFNAFEVGDRVKEGDVLGIVGNTGNSSGIHLHLGVKRVTEYGSPLDTYNNMCGYIDPYTYFYKDVTKWKGNYGLK